MEAEQSKSQLREMIDRAFSQPITPPRTSILYQLGLLLVAIVMIILPIIYFLLVAAAGWGVYYHATHNYTLISEGHFPGRVRLVLYIGPLIIGSILFLFLMMPFLPRKREKYVPLYLVEMGKEPLFVYFVHRVCDCVGAPRPRRIELIMQPNASAGFRRGFLSFLGRDMQLNVGLPLISGLTVQQLAGVLAHEFGHFRQGGGMRLYYIIETVHSWFAQGVYGGSWLEEKLSEASEEQSGQAALIILLSQLFIWLTRMFLWILLMFGSAISYFLSRQMEYDADLCQIQVAGSRDFEAVMYAINTMDAAFQKTCYMSMMSWQKRVLVNDLPALTKMEAKDLLNKKKDDIIDHILTADTRLLDTHPAARDRIARARKQNLPGACHIAAKCSALFKDYPLLCKETTWTFFEEYFETGPVEKKFLNADEYRKFFHQQEIGFAG